MITRFLMSRLDPRAVPLFKRLANLDARISLEGWVAIGVWEAVGLAALVVLIPGQGWRLVLALMVGFLFLLFPTITAMIAAILTLGELNREESRLLALSTLDGRAVFQAYFATTIWRLRVLLIFTLGGLMGLVGGAMFAARTFAEIAGLPPVLGVWAFSLIGASLGVDIAFTRHRTTFISILFIMAAITLLFLFIWIGVYFGIIITIYNTDTLTSMATAALISRLIIFGISLLPFWLIRSSLLRERNQPKWVG